MPPAEEEIGQLCTRPEDRDSALQYVEANLYGVTSLPRGLCGWNRSSVP